MPTDRTIIKLADAGRIASAGTALTATGAASLIHQVTYHWFSLTTAVVAETAGPIRMPFAGKVVSCYVTPAAAVAAHASNYDTYTLSKRLTTDFSTAIVIGTVTSVAGFTAYTPAAMTLTAANVGFAAGDVLTIQSVDNGTTTEVPFSVQVLVEWV